MTMRLSYATKTLAVLALVALAYGILIAMTPSEEVREIILGTPFSLSEKSPRAEYGDFVLVLQGIEEQEVSFVRDEHVATRNFSLAKIYPSVGDVGGLIEGAGNLELDLVRMPRWSYGQFDVRLLEVTPSGEVELRVTENAGGISRTKISETEARDIALRAAGAYGFDPEGVVSADLDDGVWSVEVGIKEITRPLYIMIEEEEGAILDLDDNSIPPNPAAASDWVIYEVNGGDPIYASGKVPIAKEHTWAYEMSGGTVQLNARDLTKINRQIREVAVSDCASGPAEPSGEKRYKVRSGALTKEIVNPTGRCKELLENIPGIIGLYLE